MQYRSEISGLCTRRTYAQFLRKRVLKNVWSSTHLRAFARIWCAFPFVTHSHLWHSFPSSVDKKQDKRQFLQTLPKIFLPTNKQLILFRPCTWCSCTVASHWQMPTFTQKFLSWTECKGKQSQSLILCYISLCCCCLNLLSFAGSVRNKEKNLHNALKFLFTALHFQSQTVQSLQCLQHVSHSLVSQCKSCQSFRFYRSFFFYQSRWRKKM